MGPDPRPPKRIEAPGLLRRLHLRWHECVLCGKERGRFRLSLHHIHKHPRDDVEANLVMLCGDGTTGCHGLIEAGHEATRKLLGRYIARRRIDTLQYLAEKLGDEQARAWLQRTLYAPV